MLCMPSDPQTTRRWLNDILYDIDAAHGFVAGIVYETFKDDNLRIYAVTRCLEIISEASRRLPDDLKARNPSIPWREIAAAGNIYRHEYETVAPRSLWRTLIHGNCSPPRRKPRKTRLTRSRASRFTERREPRSSPLALPR